MEVPPPSASWPPPTVPASLPVDSCTPVIYFSPPHLAGRLLPITQSRGSALTARHPTRALASRCDTLCCWTLPTGAPLPDLFGTETSTSVSNSAVTEYPTTKVGVVCCEVIWKKVIHLLVSVRFPSYYCRIIYFSLLLHKIVSVSSTSGIKKYLCCSSIAACEMIKIMNCHIIFWKNH